VVACRADVWAVGVTLLELLLGQLPEFAVGCVNVCLVWGGGGGGAQAIIGWSTVPIAR